VRGHRRAGIPDKEALHMFVLDGAKARIAVLALAAATAVPLLRPALGEQDTAKRRAQIRRSVDAQPAKKSEKQATDDAMLSQAWHRPLSARRALRLADVIRPDDQDVDPLKIVLAVAKQQIGKPYRYGATGPSSFDCSGFTSYVWRKAGVSLPRTSVAQYNALPHISKQHARVGDLVYSPGHIGLYIGNGKMIHAPHSGRSVEIAPIHDNVRGFARPQRKN
jgi:cell wall-associated NlpC family hydrolase